MKRSIVILIYMTLTASVAAAATIDGWTLIILDTSGSGAGEGVMTPTDDSGLRLETTRTLLHGPWNGAGGSAPSVAVVTCNEKPEILLGPTSDRRVIAEFAENLNVNSVGATSMDSTLSLVSMMKGKPADIIYIGDGLLTKPGTPSRRVVADLPAELIKMYGAAPRLHMIAVDSSATVFARTKKQWISTTDGRIAEVTKASDIQPAVEATVRRLEWQHPVIPRATEPPASNDRRRNVIAAAIAMLLTIVLITSKVSRSRLNALITVEENGRSRRASARTFGKSKVSIGDGGCDVKVANWEKPITVTEREVVDRRGRKQRQTIARQGNRSTIVGAFPVSFSNGKTTVRIRGGRR